MWRRVVWYKCTDALRQLRSGESRILCKSQIDGTNSQITCTLELDRPQHDRSAACYRPTVFFSSSLCVFIPSRKNLALFKNSVITSSFFSFQTISCRSQWPRGLRRRSATARLLRLWVRIPPGAWISVVSVVCCQVEVSATGWPLVQRSPTDCGASLCVI